VDFECNVLLQVHSLNVFPGEKISVGLSPFQKMEKRKMCVCFYLQRPGANIIILRSSKTTSIVSKVPFISLQALQLVWSSGQNSSKLLFHLTEWEKYLYTHKASASLLKLQAGPTHAAHAKLAVWCTLLSRRKKKRKTNIHALILHASAHKNNKNNKNNIDNNKRNRHT
jgi:hypothetical protein